MKKFLTTNKTFIFQIIVFVLIFGVFVLVTSTNYIKPIQLRDNEDISYEFDQATSVLNGGNPYERISKGNLLVNKKYATLFPLYYYFLSIFSYFSGEVFKTFIKYYWYVLHIFQFFSAYLVFLFFKREQKGWVGILAASIFLLNRWTVGNTLVLKQDTISIFFLLLGVYSLSKYPKLSFLSYGISLGIKHLSIFAFPIFLIYLINQRKDFKKILVLISMVLIPIVVPSIRFLIDNPTSFFYSLMFSATRAPISVGTTNFTGFEKLLVNYSNLGNTFAAFYLFLPRLPLVLTSLFALFLLFTKRISYFTYLPVIYLVFTGLNPVYFVQYSMWITPFVLFPILNPKNLAGE